MFTLKIWWLVLLFTGRSSGDVNNEPKLNMVGFTLTPAVQRSGLASIRGYTLGPDKSENITLNITLLEDGSLSSQPLCPNSASSVNVVCKVAHVGLGNVTSTYREAEIAARPRPTQGNSEANVRPRVGQFTVYADKDNRNAMATIVVHHKNATVIPIVRTKTVSEGDRNVTLGVVCPDTQCTGEHLQWKKDGILNEEWTNMTDILIENITLVGAGIYECYKNNEQGTRRKHAFMQLIVRECPHNKWSPPSCTMDCEVCYNGGVCDTYIGTCICPSGFYGSRCEKSSGGNRFGRDGKIPCDSVTDNGCRGNLICPPLPQGCACHAGWKGLDCTTECEAGKYGADCLQVCHCNATQCDRSRGCDLNATCHPGYVGERCLVNNTSGDSSHTTSDVGTTNDPSTTVSSTSAPICTTQLTTTKKDETTSTTDTPTTVNKISETINVIKSVEEELIGNGTSDAVITETYYASYVIFEDNFTGNYEKKINTTGERVDIAVDLTETEQVSLFIGYSYKEANASDQNILIDYESANKTENTTYYIVSGLLTINAYVGGNSTGADITYSFSSTDPPKAEIIKGKRIEKTLFCAFFKESSGSWSSVGCTIDSQQECTCYHLTSFAILMQVTENELDSIVQVWITRIGVGISTACMAFTLVVYFFFRDLRNSCRNNIHKNLISSMILFNITFLSGIDSVDNKVACKVVAIMLHYLLLTSLMWMMSEAVYLYYKVIRISPMKRNTLATYMFICYLTPLAIVVPVATIFDKMYATDTICWLSPVGRWTVVVPCALIVTFNLIVLVKILVIVRERESGHKVKGRTVRQEENKQMKKTVQGCIILQPILGLTWILGPFASNIIVAYVFNVTSAFQGFFIFIAYCVYDKEVKSAWRKWKKDHSKCNAIHTSSGNLPDSTEPTKETKTVDVNTTTAKDRKMELKAMAGKSAWR